MDFFQFSVHGGCKSRRVILLPHWAYYNKMFRYDERICLLLLLYYLPVHHTLFLHLFSPLLNLGIVPITQSTRLQYYMTICEKGDCGAGQRMDVKSILICL